MKIRLVHWVIALVLTQTRHLRLAQSALNWLWDLSILINCAKSPRIEKIGGTEVSKRVVYGESSSVHLVHPLDFSALVNYKLMINFAQLFRLVKRV